MKTGTGPLQRPPDSGYRGADYDFITVETKAGQGRRADDLRTRSTRGVPAAKCAGSARRAQLLSELVATASNDQNRDQQIGRTLFNLLIPVELEAYLAGSGEMQIELDPETAEIPWELLDTKSECDHDPQPWAIRVKLLRKLRIERIPRARHRRRRRRQRARDRRAGVSPGVSHGSTARATRPWPCARCLTATGALDESSVTGLISDDPSQAGANARTVVNALFEKPWRIVHIAGHGMPGENGKPGGVVLSNGTFLGPDEIRQHAHGARAGVRELLPPRRSGDADPAAEHGYDRAEFASGVAGALIEIGVRCVIAAGWAVDDDAASVFAEDVLRFVASRESLHRGRRRGARGGVRPKPEREHVGGLPVLRRPGLGVPAARRRTPISSPRRRSRTFPAWPRRRR